VPLLATASKLATLIADAPLWCAWAGGDGQDTLSALLALRQAQAGRRALVLTIDVLHGRLAGRARAARSTNIPLS